ncbi:MAG: serine/threonine-protein kinase, partial [Gemmataceae bacterium]
MPTTRTQPLAPPGYTLVSFLGEGGMGVVLRAEDTILRRMVAIKYLSDRFASDSTAALRFRAEAAITAQLPHPGIPPIHAVGTLSDGRPYLVMKLIEGRTFQELLREFGPRNPRALAIFTSLCQTVAYAHSRGVIHRDLKFVNVMVGAFGEVQVMDWGLAKRMDRLPPREAEFRSVPTPVLSVNPATETSQATGAWTPADSSEDDSATQTGTVLGTPAFMAPEQARGELHRLAPATDVFALGVMLYQILTGRSFHDSASRSILESLHHGTFLEQRQQLQACGAEPSWIQLCDACLEADPSARPTDAGELVRRIEQLQAQLATDAEENRRAADRILVEQAESAKRRRLRTLLLTGLMAVLVSGIVGTSLGLHRATVARDTARSTANEAREALDAILGDRAKGGLLAQATLTPEQQQLYRDLLPKYAKFAAATETDRSSREQVASAALRLSQMHMQLGDRAAADQYAEQ